LKNSNDTIGNRTHDLPACSAVPQPTAPPRAPCVYKYVGKIIHPIVRIIYSFLILWVEFHIARMQTKFCQSFLHHVEGIAGLLDKASAPRSWLPNVARTLDSISVFVIILTINSNYILGLYNGDVLGFL